MQRRSFCIATGASLALAATRGLAQTTGAGGNWPNKPLQFITAYAPGGLGDQVARYVGDRIAMVIGQPVIHKNIPGAGGLVGTEAAARIAPDGYNFLVSPTGPLCISPWLIATAKYTLDDFAPIAKLASSYSVITLRKDLPFATYKEFITAAKAAPGKYTFASNGVGSITHLIGLLLHKQAGVDIVHVPYKSSVAAMTDMVGGRIDLMYDPVTLPRIKEGVLKAVGTTNSQRNPAIPNVPTLAEQGFSDVPRSWFGLFAPKGTPPELLARLGAEAQKVMTNPAARNDLLAASIQPDFDGPVEFAKLARKDSDFFKEVIQRDNIKAES